MKLTFLSVKLTNLGRIPQAFAGSAVQKQGWIFKGPTNFEYLFRNNHTEPLKSPYSAWYYTMFA